MGGNWKRFIEKKGLEKWFRRDNMLILVLAGVLLFVIALPTKDSRGTSDSSSGYQSLSREGAGAAGQQAEQAAEELSEEQYGAAMEARLTEVLSGMDGVGRVQVMITIKESRELVVEKEQPVSRSSTNENDSQGGSRVVNQVQSEENTVYRTEGSESEPYVIKTISPQVEGVLVVAEGAGTGTVNRTIVEIVQALFGVEAHKVKVVKMQAGK